MGITKNLRFKKILMRAVIALVVLIAMSTVSAQAVQKKWLCCKKDNMYEPTWGSSCGSRRLQAVVEPYRPKKLESPKRILQEVQHPVAPNCVNFKASRRLQSVVTYKCPVNIEGYQCFKNNTGAKCA